MPLHLYSCLTDFSAWSVQLTEGKREYTPPNFSLFCNAVFDVSAPKSSKAAGFHWTTFAMQRSVSVSSVLILSHCDKTCTEARIMRFSVKSNWLSYEFGGKFDYDIRWLGSISRFYVGHGSRQSLAHDYNHSDGIIIGFRLNGQNAFAVV